MQINKIEREIQTSTLAVSPQYPLTTLQPLTRRWKKIIIKLNKIFSAETNEIEVSALVFFSLFCMAPWNCRNSIASTVYGIPHTHKHSISEIIKRNMHTQINSIFSPRNTEFYYDCYFIYIFIYYYHLGIVTFNYDCALELHTHTQHID